MAAIQQQPYPRPDDAAPAEHQAVSHASWREAVFRAVKIIRTFVDLKHGTFSFNVVNQGDPAGPLEGTRTNTCNLVVRVADYCAYFTDLVRSYELETEPSTVPSTPACAPNKPSAGGEVGQHEPIRSGNHLQCAALPASTWPRHAGSDFLRAAAPVRVLRQSESQHAGRLSCRPSKCIGCRGLRARLRAPPGPPPWRQQQIQVDAPPAGRCFALCPRPAAPAR